MEFLIDFLESEKVMDAKIFSQLKCGAEEAKMLQMLSQKFIGGEEDFLVSDLLKELYGTQEYVYLNHLGEVKTLLELGWVTQHSFTPLKVNDLSPLELLNTAVALTSSFLKLLEEGSLEMTLPDI